jgi:hypothetical protein
VRVGHGERVLARVNEALGGVGLAVVRAEMLDRSRVSTDGLRSCPSRAVVECGRIVT